jgi:hypothetical protein
MAPDSKGEKESEQHAGENMRPISVAFALISASFACEWGYSGRQPQHRHKISGARR